MVDVCVSQVAACPHIDSLEANHCWVVQLFHISCTHTGYGTSGQYTFRHNIYNHVCQFCISKICIINILLRLSQDLTCCLLHMHGKISGNRQSGFCSINLRVIVCMVNNTAQNICMGCAVHARDLKFTSRHLRSPAKLCIYKM